MSIANETGSITLAGESFPVRAFTLDELQTAVPLITGYYEAFRVGDGVAPIAAAKKVLALALRKEEAEIGSIPATVADLWSAIDVIAEVAGLKALGERMRATTPAMSTGTDSMPTSSTSAPETGTPSGG